MGTRPPGLHERMLALRPWLASGVTVQVHSTIGLGARAYPHRLISVTGEFNVEVTRFKGFDRLKTDWDGHFVDFDVYATINAGRNFAVLGGYRSLKVDYTSDTDTATMRMKGLYWGGNVRF